MRLPSLSLSLTLCVALFCVCFVSLLPAQDAVKVDPNITPSSAKTLQVRILKVHYGPHEKSVMHGHPDGVAVFITDAKVQFTYPDGKKEDSN